LRCHGGPPPRRRARDVQAPGAARSARRVADHRVGEGPEARDRAAARGVDGGGRVVAPSDELGAPVLLELRRLRQDGTNVAIVTLNRPDTLNAIDRSMIDALAGVITTVDGAPTALPRLMP